jgi:septin 7
MVLVFRNKVQEREDKLRRSEQELHARHREMRNTLDAQLRDLEERKRQLESESVVSSRLQHLSLLCSPL